MQLGILGWPLSGKTTLFQALTGRATPPEHGGPATAAVVQVPDPRVDRLAALFQPRKTTRAEVLFLDPPGERRTAGDRPGFPEPLLAAVRDVDALVLVVRAFEDPAVPRPPGSVAPAADLLAIEQELLLRDLEIVEKRLARLRKEGNKPEAQGETALLRRALDVLESERPLRSVPWSEDDRVRMRGFQFLSLKPVLVVVNVGEDDLGKTAGDDLEDRDDRPVLRLSARMEREILDLEVDERQEFLEPLGITEPARDRLIRRAFACLDLITFFTVGEDEVRAWPVRRGARAPEAAGRIHTDLQKGFIRAEVIHYDTFMEIGSLAAAKSQGKLRLEGKDYEVQDGDILHVRHA